ncbi:hypothetical protein B0H14DRAFT_2791377, partial [Mycena olivaceomarginata]
MAAAGGELASLLLSQLLGWTGVHVCVCPSWIGLGWSPCAISIRLGRRREGYTGLPTEIRMGRVGYIIDAYHRAL